MAQDHLSAHPSPPTEPQSQQRTSAERRSLRQAVLHLSKRFSASLSWGLNWQPFPCEAAAQLSKFLPRAAWARGLEVLLKVTEGLHSMRSSAPQFQRRFNCREKT